MNGRRMIPLIHVGYHKTGTTWLQEMVFRQDPAFRFIADHAVLWPLIMAPHDLEFEPDAARATLAQLLAQEAPTDAVPVLSSERLSGNPHSGAYDNKILADRLRSLLPEARILIVVRNQAAMLVSNYKQYVRMGGICSFEEYLAPPLDGRIPLFRWQNFEFHRLVEYYGSLYGRERVLVLPYELLRQDPRQFLIRLAEFCGVGLRATHSIAAVNESLNDLAIEFRRRLNRWHGGDSLFPVKPRWPKLSSRLLAWNLAMSRKGVGKAYDAGYRAVARSWAERYRDSNRALQSWIKDDLGSLGYPMPDAGTWG